MATQVQSDNHTNAKGDSYYLNDQDNTTQLSISEVAERLNVNYGDIYQGFRFNIIAEPKRNGRNKAYYWPSDLRGIATSLAKHRPKLRSVIRGISRFVPNIASLEVAIQPITPRSCGNDFYGCKFTNGDLTNATRVGEH